MPSGCFYWRPRLGDIRTQMAMLVEQLSTEGLTDFSSKKSLDDLRTTCEMNIKMSASTLPFLSEPVSFEAAR